MAKAPQKHLLEEHESSVRMNAAAADRCRKDTTTWRDWGDPLSDPVLNPQPRRKPRRKRRKTQQRADQIADQISFSNESVQRIQGRGGAVHLIGRWATATIYPTHG